MTRTTSQARDEGWPAPTNRRASSARAKSPTAILALATLLLASSSAIQSARADQVPAGSGSYLHVGDNAWAVAGNQANAPAFDGNASSRASMGSGTGAYPQCSQTQTNFTFNAPAVAKGDLLHVVVSQDVGGTGGGNPGTSCLGVGYRTSDGGASVLVAVRGACNSCTDTIDVWANLTLPPNVNVTGLWIVANQICSPCGGYSRTAYVNEAELLDKNATTSDPIRAIANQAAANVQCYSTGAAYGNFASNVFTAPYGTFYLMIPSIMPSASASGPNPMQIYAPLGGVNASFYGWSRVVPDVTGARTDAVAVWRVTSTQGGVPIYVKPAGSANVNATDTVCAFNRVGAMYSTTLANGYVTAPLTTWGGSANDLWGVAYMANAYPINAVYDTDLNGQSGTIFNFDNMTTGAQLFATGTTGVATSVSVATLPAFAREGNAVLIAVGQQAGAQGSSTNYQILVDGSPASVIANSGFNAQGFQYALFYVDDVALRNGLNNTASNVGQSAYRPFGAESYSITLAGGFDNALPVYAGNTYGLLGHAGITCLTLCGSNLFNYASRLPAANANRVTFNVTNATTGQPIAGARVVNTNNTTALFTNAAGMAVMSNAFTPTHYSIGAPGYASTCADFYYKSGSFPVNGTKDSLGCGYVIGASATFNVHLGTARAVTGNGGSAEIGGATSVEISFNVTNPTFQSGQLVQVTVNRTASADLWIVLYALDNAGNPQRAGGFTPYDWTPAQPNSLPVSWPDGRVLNAADSGNYVLTVSAQSSSLVNGTLLAYDPIGVEEPAPVVGTSLLTNLNVAAQNDINRQAQVNNAVLVGAVTEATVQQDFLTWLDWFPRTDLFLPNAVLYPALFMMGALMLRFGRNSWGR